MSIVEKYKLRISKKQGSGIALRTFTEQSFQLAVTLNFFIMKC